MTSEKQKRLSERVRVQWNTINKWLKNKESQDYSNGTEEANRVEDNLFCLSSFSDSLRLTYPWRQLCYVKNYYGSWEFVYCR